VGAWGPGIFSDDTACDVRDEFRDLIGQGLSVEAATDQVMQPYVGDSDDGPVALIALALTQWKTGRLLDGIRDRAVDVIDSGVDLVRWQDSTALGKRKQALKKAREQLLTPQPRAVRIAKVEKSTTPFAGGDVIVYQHDSGRSVVLWCVANKTDKGGTYSHFELLDVDPEVAARKPDQARKSKGRADLRPGPNWSVAGFLVTGCQQMRPDQYRIVGRVERPADRPRVSMTVVFANPTQQKLLPGSLDRVLDPYISEASGTATPSKRARFPYLRRRN